MASNQETLRLKYETAPTSLEGVMKVWDKIIPDERGSVMEFYRQSDYEASGLPALGERPQVNAPFTVSGALRGIHAEFAKKLVAVAGGKIYAVIVDLRTDQASFGRWEGFELSRGEGLFIPEGFGNSFEALDDAYYLYYFSEEWRPGMPGIACTPLDEELGIDWRTPRDKMILSDKDLANPTLSKLRELGGKALS